MGKSDPTMATAHTAPDSAHELWDELSCEIWQVRRTAFASEPRLMSLGEIDVALQRGEIDANALVSRVGAEEWRSLADIAGIEPGAVKALSFVSASLCGGAGELPAQPVAAVDEDDSDSYLPEASSVDVMDAAVVPMAFDLATSPVPAVMFVEDAFPTGALRYAGGGRSSVKRRSASVAMHALRGLGLVATFAGVFVGVSTFLANTYGEGRSDAAFVLRAPALGATVFESPEPVLAAPRPAVPANETTVEPAPLPLMTLAPVVMTDEAPKVDAPKPVVKAAPAAKAAPEPKGLGISTSERAWDTRAKRRK